MNQEHIEPGVGIGKIRFGLIQSEAEILLGKPDKVILGDEIIHIYDKLQMRLTYYHNEASKLGYIDSSNPNLKYKETQVINSSIDEVLELLRRASFTEWEIEEYDSFTSFFNEKSRITLNVEYQLVKSIEFGVPFLNDNEYRWPK